MRTTYLWSTRESPARSTPQSPQDLLSRPESSSKISGVRVERCTATPWDDKPRHPTPALWEKLAKF